MIEPEEHGELDPTFIARNSGDDGWEATAQRHITPSLEHSYEKMAMALETKVDQILTNIQETGAVVCLHREYVQSQLSAPGQPACLVHLMVVQGKPEDYMEKIRKLSRRYGLVLDLIKSSDIEPNKITVQWTQDDPAIYKKLGRFLCRRFVLIVFLFCLLFIAGAAIYLFFLQAQENGTGAKKRMPGDWGEEPIVIYRTKDRRDEDGRVEQTRYYQQQQQQEKGEEEEKGEDAQPPGKEGAVSDVKTRGDGEENTEKGSNTDQEPSPNSSPEKQSQQKPPDRWQDKYFIG